MSDSTRAESDEKYELGVRVNTPDGVGEIKKQDSVEGNNGREFLNRWGVLHDVYPPDKTPGWFRDDLLYYHPEDLTRIVKEED